MARRPPDTQTPDLFEVPQPAAPNPASMDYRTQVSALTSELLRLAGHDRYEISAQVSRLSGKEVSKFMLDAYCSEAREEFNLPFWMVPALESVASSHLLTNWLVGVRGGRLLVGRDALHAELGRLEKEIDDRTQIRSELLKRMGERS